MHIFTFGLSGFWKTLLSNSAVAVAHYYHAPWTSAMPRPPWPSQDDQSPMQRYLISM